MFARNVFGRTDVDGAKAFEDGGTVSG